MAPQIATAKTEPLETVRDRSNPSLNSRAFEAILRAVNPRTRRDDTRLRSVRPVVAVLR